MDEQQLPPLPTHWVPAELLGASHHYTRAAWRYAEEYARAALAAQGVPAVVWEISNRTFSALFDTEQTAKAYAAGFTATAGLALEPRPVHRAATPVPPQAQCRTSCSAGREDEK